MTSSLSLYCVFTVGTPISILKDSPENKEKLESENSRNATAMHLFSFDKLNSDRVNKRFVRDEWFGWSHLCTDFHLSIMRFLTNVL